MQRGIVLLSLALISPLAVSQMPGPFGGPPPEAYAACQKTGEGGTCRFDAPHGEVRGTCRTMREGRPVCVPGYREGRPEPERAERGRPPRPVGVEIAGRNPNALKVESRVPDTGQGSCFDALGLAPCGQPGSRYYGQDADYAGAEPSYRDNRDGTVSDLVTGLMWQRAHNATRLGYYEAEADCRQLRLGGHSDWRLPSIKELFSIADFRGAVGRRPYLDDDFEIRPPSGLSAGDPFAASHSPEMMGQTWSSTKYTGEHFGRPGVEAAFFFNFLDGRIKQAPTRGREGLFHRCVRGPAWGENRFVDLGQGGIRDEITGLVWQQADDGRTRDWPEALAYCRNLELGGVRGWRLPNVKELQSIVDYRLHAPALDERFLKMSDPKGWFWSGTTHGDNVRNAAYVCFGPCTSVDGVDVHGAGAQRSDPKTGNPAAFGPQGGQRDEVRIRNYVRCVR